MTENTTTIRLSDSMPNGARVSDWLGTAMTAARLSARNLDDVRNGSPDDVACLREALEYANQAADEISQVMHHYGLLSLDR